MTAVIEVAGLTKSFGRTRALDGLDLTVAPGEVHGFLGPNGAGKTTTIRVLLGLIRAAAGPPVCSAATHGGKPTTLHRRLAYVPGDVTLWPNLSGGEVIDLLGRLRGGLDEKRKAALLERFELDPATKSRAYSKGNRQKVALIAALSSGAELLMLDEPTSGLDPLMEATFRGCVEEERQAGRTVLLSSHILSEVEALCDRVTIIREGRTVDSGALADLRHLRAPRCTPRWPGRRTGWPGSRGSMTWTSAGTGSAARSTTTRSARCSRGWSPRAPHPGQPAAHAGGAVPAALLGPVMTAVAARAQRPGGPAARHGPAGLTGTAALISLALRRDRIILPVWLYVFAGSIASTGYSFRHLYTRLPERLALIASVRGDASVLALSGPVFGDSAGSLVAWKVLVFAAGAAGLMGIFTVVRHTRDDEEQGRLELVGATAVGRQAPLAAALAVAFGSCLALILLIAAVQVILGYPLAARWPWAQR